MSKAANPVGVGFIGAGDVSILHAKAVERCPGARLVGLWNRTESRARERAEEFGCRRFESPEALIADPDVGAVLVLTNLETHLEYTKMALEAGKPVLVLGDFNTAHREIDLARPRDNKKNSGFLPEERAEVSRWLAAGWVDVFRKQHPDEPGHYSWWRQWGNARADNVGWRIDYVFASPAAMKHVTGAFILPNVTGSDHCPCGVTVDPKIFG